MSLNDSLSIGIDYVPVTIDTPENTSNDGGVNTNKVYVTFEDLTTIYAKLNVPLGGTYLKVGYSTVNIVSPLQTPGVWETFVHVHSTQIEMTKRRRVANSIVKMIKM